MSPSPLRFAHLTVQTDHSRNGSVVQIQPLVRRAAELGRHVIGIADDDVMTGVPELRQAAAQAGIRPVFGVRLAVDGGDRSDGSGATTAEESSSRRARVTLTARTDDGLRNLYRLCSLAWLRGTPQAPAVSYDQLRTHRAGIMAITGDRYSEVGRHVLAGDLAAARDTLDKLVWALGPAWTRLAICVTREGPDPVLLEALADLADRAGVATVATANVQYLRPEDERHHRAALCVATRSTLADPGAVPAPDATWLDPAIDDVAWARVRAAVMENDRLAMWCRADPLRRRSAPPRFMPEGDDQSVLLRARVATGLRERYGDPVPAAARERAEAELEVIGRRSWDAYFLIVEGIVRWAEGQGIPVGPGRGSAAGAIVNYALRITDVDPLHFDLLFERFLSPDRVSMPDIDIDFSVKGRERVMEYVTDKYGRERVAQIVTFGRMLPRNATKDSARIHGYDYATGDRLAKLIPEPIMGKTPPLEECLAEGTELRQTYDTDPVAKEVLDTARGLEGNIRAFGMHAAAVVISDRDLTQVVPLLLSDSRKVDEHGKKIYNQVTQFPMGPVEELGLLKMDFLGLRNLDVIDDALAIIERSSGERIDIAQVPLDDRKTYEMLARGDSIGVFQFESEGMRKALRQVVPTEFDDLIALVALYRPGAMDQIPTYAQGKHDPSMIRIPDPRLEPIIGPTKGVILYQEQSMRISRDLAGFTPGQADDLRKAIGKKKRDKLIELEPLFRRGATSSGTAPNVVDQVWHALYTSGNYSFNKSHAACYGLVSYRTAWLKANHPAEYMAALLSSVLPSKDKVRFFLNVCRDMGIPVLPSDDVRASRFTVRDGAIRSPAT